MKFALSLFVCCFASSSAFAPQSHAFLSQTTKPASRSFFMTDLAAKESKSMEEEVEEMVQADLAKKRKYSKFSNERGVEYAPWMTVSEEDEAKTRQVMREKAQARRKRQEQEQNVQGALLKDSTAQELGGTGLRYKVIDGDSVELEWATASETSTQGFIVKRRAAKTDDFEVLASFESYGPLASKGVEGGVYRYLDENVPTGGYVYRVTERETNGKENDLSQCLVEMQTPEEQRGAVIAAVAFGAVAVAAIAAGTLLDPVQY